MGWLGDVWDGVKSAAGSAWDGLTGGGGWVENVLSGIWSFGWSFIKGLLHHLFGALIELPCLFGICPEKKLRLRVIILQGSDPHAKSLRPVATRSRTQEAVDLATEIFKAQVNVKVIGANGSIVRMSPEKAPETALKPPCGGKRDYVLAQFNSTGAWFRHRRATNLGSAIGYATPVTVFVVEQVQGGSGCAVAGLFGDYAYIGADVLSSVQPLGHVSLAHETGHVCDLIRHHSNAANVMHWRQAEVPRRKFSRWQRYVIRGGSHVTYL
jgi:hypothetical protein